MQATYGPCTYTMMAVIFRCYDSSSMPWTSEKVPASVALSPANSQSTIFALAVCASFYSTTFRRSKVHPERSNRSYYPPRAPLLCLCPSLTQVRRRKKILVHCRHGSSTSVAVITAYRLLKHGVGVRNTLSAIARARGDSMDLSPSMATGLQQLQVECSCPDWARL